MRGARELTGGVVAVDDREGVAADRNVADLGMIENTDALRQGPRRGDRAE